MSATDAEAHAAKARTAAVKEGRQGFADWQQKQADEENCTGIFNYIKGAERHLPQPASQVKFQGTTRSHPQFAIDSKAISWGEFW